MNRRLTWLTLSAVLLASNGALFSDTLKGVFTFDGKPPRVALAYFGEDTSLSIPTATVDQVSKEFTTYLIVGAKDTKLQFKNSDNIDHNIYVNDNDADVNFDVGLAEPGSVVSKPMDWKDNRVVRVSCKIHPNMRMYIAKITSKYHVIVNLDKPGFDGKWEIKDVPAQCTKLSLWMPGLDPIETAIGPGKKATLKITKKSEERGSVVLTRG